MSSGDKPLLFVLITRRKWRKVYHLLKSDSALALLREKDDSNLNCLSLALGFKAPLKILEKIMDLDPALSLEKDVFGATALHVACLNGSPIDAVTLLLKRHEDLAYEVDVDNRVALHHAIEFAGSQEGSHHKDYTHDTYIDVLRVICKAAPDTLYSVDKVGETPIDLLQGMKIKCPESSPRYEKLDLLYSELTHQSVEFYKETRRRWELEGYMTNLCSNQLIADMSAETSISSAAETTTSSIQTPNSEGRNLNLDADSDLFQEASIENNQDQQERQSDMLETIME